jgi:hypothetical protein
MSRSLISRSLSVWCLLSLAFAGCSEGAKGTVKGKVTYKEAPVTGYVLNLVWKEKGFAATIPVGDDGSFSLADPMEPGTYTAYLSPKPPEPQPPGTPLKKSSVGKIPAKYADAEKSDLKVTLKGGPNELPLELKD